MRRHLWTRRRDVSGLSRMDHCRWMLHGDGRRVRCIRVGRLGRRMGRSLRMLDQAGTLRHAKAQIIAWATAALDPGEARAAEDKVLAGPGG